MSAILEPVSNARIGRWLGGIAHQVRSPLAAALLYAGHLDGDALPAATRTRFTRRLRHCLAEVDAQLRDMLSIARGDLEAEQRVEVADLARAVETCRAQDVRSGRLRIEFDAGTGSARIRCAPAALRGALGNLIDNAFEAGAGNVEIRFRVRAGRLGIRVADDGPGFDPALRACPGTPFATTKPGGTGLGLAVVRAVARAHRGCLRIRDTGAGVHACLSLPIDTGCDSRTQAATGTQA